MKRITRPRAESLFTLYGGTECEPRQMMYRLLAEAMNREDTERIDYLDNTIVIVINMRLEGIIEKLAEGAVSLRGKKVRWTRHQIAWGEEALKHCEKHAVNHLHNILMPGDDASDYTVISGLGLAMTFLWGLYDTVYNKIQTEVKAKKSKPHQLLPRPRAGDIS